MKNMFKKGSTLFLKAAVVFMALVVLAISIFALPEIWKGGSAEYPVASTALLMIMIGLYLTIIPFYVALWQTLKLLTHIDRNDAFSEASVKALRMIKYCGAVISVLYITGVPFLFPIAQADDAPGLILIGAAIACAPIVVTVFAAVLERLLGNAIEFKSENDLTV
jgi:hypothetical protein